MGAREVSQWIEAARAGDERAVAHLCELYEPRLSAYVSRALGARARRWVDPADVVQRALFETLRSLDGLPSCTEEELSRRLHRTARSRMRDAIRKHRREVGESVLAELERDRAASRPSTGSVTRADARDYLLQLLDGLPDELGEAVKLCALEELSFVDAGKRLGLSADAVRKRYERARAAIEQRFASARTV